MKKKLLLHVCCAPCADFVIDQLSKDYNVVCFWYNPNIHPSSEYEKRLAEVEKMCDNKELPLIKSEYDLTAYFAAISGLEDQEEGGMRCLECFKQRLVKTAEYAKENGFEVFGTTLSVSKFKAAAQIHEAGYTASDITGVNYLAKDFSKDGDDKKALKQAKDKGYYLQNYCGCVFSMR